MWEIEASRIHERETLLSHITRLLEHDTRVQAVWLEGSFARGESDVWSDLDLWTLVDDQSFAEFAQDRYQILESMGNEVLRVEAPQNGPANGFYLMAGFDAPSGIHMLDWYCQPVSSACRPKSPAVIFIRPALARSDSWQSRPAEDGINQIFRRTRRGDDTLQTDQPLRLWHPTHQDEAINAGNLAWAMVAIQAKEVLRNPNDPTLKYENFLANLVKKASMGLQTLRPSVLDMAFPIQKLDRLAEITKGIDRAISSDPKLSDSVHRLLETSRKALLEHLAVEESRK